MIPGQLDRLVAETAGFPIADDTVKLRTTGLNYIAEMKETFALYSSDGRGAALHMVMTDRGKALMDEVRAAAATIRADQQQKLLIRIAAAATTGRYLLTAQIGTALLVVVISIVTGAGFYRNIGTLRHAQDALTDANANLEQIVETRTAALSQANDEIQKFAYIVSHDLRAPLVNIMDYERTGGRGGDCRPLRQSSIKQPGNDVPAEVVEAIGEDVPEAFRFIKTSTAKMDGLIGAILQLSREGRRVLTPEPLAMRQLVENIAATQKHRLDEKGAEIVVQPLPSLTADRLAIEQVFGNLLDNAVKYLSPDRPGVITVRGATNGPFAVFEVEDNGRGIAPGDHERVFELFRRAGQQNVPGEGIGLAYVRQLVYQARRNNYAGIDVRPWDHFKLNLPLAGTKT